MTATTIKMHALALVSMAAIVGCVPPPRSTQQAVKPNEGTTVLVDANRADLLETALGYAMMSGWRVEVIDRIRGVIEAVTVVNDDEGWVTRERWIFRAGDGELAVTMRPEERVGETWASSDMVCITYGFHRERAALDKVASMVVHHNETAVASADRE